MPPLCDIQTCMISIYQSAGSLTNTVRAVIVLSITRLCKTIYDAVMSGKIVWVLGRRHVFCRTVQLKKLIFAI
jgi:hypothetical protein